MNGYILLPIALIISMTNTYLMQHSSLDGDGDDIAVL
jgi:hypothetical protein